MNAIAAGPGTRQFLLLFAVCLLTALPVAAQTWPNRPIRFVVPSVAGSTTDVIARALAAEISVSLGQRVVVDNRPGAGGKIGAGIGAKAAPDGYTIVMGTVVTHAINASLYTKLPYDPVRDFAPITQIAGVPDVLEVSTSLPIKSVNDLVVYAKANPGKLTFASSGNGTPFHSSGELFKSMTGLDMALGPYKSGAAAATGQNTGTAANVVFEDLPSAMAHAKSGQLRTIAVTTLARSAALPGVPTISESGVSGYDASAWFGALAPAGTPNDVVSRLHDEIVKALNSPRLQASLKAQGAEPVGDTPEQFTAYISAEITKWARVVKQSGVHIK